MFNWLRNLFSRSDKIIGYCMKCKTKRDIINGIEFQNKTGQNMIKGYCSKCGTKMNSFINNDK